MQGSNKVRKDIVEFLGDSCFLELPMFFLHLKAALVPMESVTSQYFYLIWLLSVKCSALLCSRFESCWAPACYRSPRILYSWRIGHALHKGAALFIGSVVLSDLTQNTGSKIQLLQISRRQQQRIKPNGGHVGGDRILLMRNFSTWSLYDLY